MIKKSKELYETPEIIVVGLKSRRVLCQSPAGVYDPNDYEDGGDALAS